MLGTIRMVLGMVAAVVKLVVAIIYMEGIDNTMTVDVADKAKNRATGFLLGEKSTLIC